MDLGINPDLLKTIGAALVGAIGFKIVERFLNSKEAADEHVTLRHELREELNTMREEVNVLKAEVNQWRERYYTQLELNATLQVQISILRNELDDYKSGSNAFDLTDRGEQ